MILNLVPGLLVTENLPGTLLSRNPEYENRWWWREFGRVSYVGGREYARPSRLTIDFQFPVGTEERTTTGEIVYRSAVQSNKSLLFRHNREKEWEFYNRRQRAYYFNFPRTIINALVSQAMKNPPEREGDDAITEFWGGIDQNRTQTIDNFMRQGQRYAQTQAIMWAFVDVKSPQQGGDGKPYAYWVSPLDILDWDVDDNGEIVWLKQFCYAEARREWNQPITIRYRIRIWRRDRVDTYETDSAGTQTGAVVSRPHGAGQVPCEPLFSIRDEDYTFPDGTALAADLCKGANHVYNLGSLLSDILYKQTFSWLAIPDPNVDVVQMGTNTAFGYDPARAAAPSFVSPDADQARVILESISGAIEQLRHSFGVGRGRSEGSMTKSSADALELESEDKRSILGDIASEGQDFEIRLAKLFQAYRTNSVRDAEIRYSTEFNVAALQNQIDEALSFQKLKISPEVNLEMVRQLVRRKFSGMSQSKLDDLLGTLKAEEPQPVPAALAAAAGGDAGDQEPGDPPPPASGKKDKTDSAAGDESDDAPKKAA